jgi:hypothetical protein
MSEGKPLKIEAGKYYKTRDGRKAFVAAVAINPFGTTPVYPVWGFIGNDDYYWAESGEYYFRDRDPNPLDIISEWKEPVVVKRYVAWVRDDYGEVRPWCGQPHHSREAAEDSCDSLNYELLRIDEISYTDE